MYYISTRGNKKKINFKEVTLSGLAKDGGLYVPNSWGKFSFRKKKLLSFQEVSYRLISQYTGKSIDKKNLKKIINKSYENFSSLDVTPIQNIDKNHSILELFHGPTLAFKDIALQLLGNLFDYYLKKDKKKLTIIGATSGDTGSAAIEAVKELDNVNIFILHPYKRVSEFQRRQMTTVNSKNVHNIALKGNFDDCQDIVKRLFQDEILNKYLSLGSINSINWTRILSQISYYVYAFFRIKNIYPEKEINFSVPTGNFGDAYAGYLAKEKLKIPFKKIIVATNKNDILDKFFRSGSYSKSRVRKTITPSMDIQVASNFERLLHDLYSQNGKNVKDVMLSFKKKQYLKIEKNKHLKAKKIFSSYSISEKETISTIKKVYYEKSIVLDPHSAIGVSAGINFLKNNKNSHVITLATAHPAKFSEAVKKAIGIDPQPPKRLAGICELEESYDIFDKDFNKIRDFILLKS